MRADAGMVFGAWGETWRDFGALCRVPCRVRRVQNERCVRFGLGNQPLTCVCARMVSKLYKPYIPTRFEPNFRGFRSFQPYINRTQTLHTAGSQGYWHYSAFGRASPVCFRGSFQESPRYPVRVTSSKVLGKSGNDAQDARKGH